MKFLVIFTIASVCVLNSEAFFFGKHGKGGASSSASAGSDAFAESEPTNYPAPVEQPPAPQQQAPAASGHGGFDLSSLMAIPMQLKMKLLEAKKQKIQKLVGQFSGLTSKFSGGFGGSSSGAHSGSSSGAAVAETYQQQPAPQHAYQQTPVVLHLYQIENSNAQSHAHSVASSYQAPAPQYGPPPAPVAQQQVSSVDTSYLPPHGNCQDNSHYH